MSKITNDGLTRSGTCHVPDLVKPSWCFTAVPMATVSVKGLMQRMKLHVQESAE